MANNKKNEEYKKRIEQYKRAIASEKSEIARARESYRNKVYKSKNDASILKGYVEKKNIRIKMWQTNIERLKKDIAHERAKAKK